MRETLIHSNKRKRPDTARINATLFAPKLPHALVQKSIQRLYVDPSDLQLDLEPIDRLQTAEQLWVVLGAWAEDYHLKKRRNLTPFFGVLDYYHELFQQNHYWDRLLQNVCGYLTTLNFRKKEHDHDVTDLAQKNALSRAENQMITLLCNERVLAIFLSFCNDITQHLTPETLDVLAKASVKASRVILTTPALASRLPDPVFLKTRYETKPQEWARFLEGTSPEYIYFSSGVSKRMQILNEQREWLTGAHIFEVMLMFARHRMDSDTLKTYLHGKKDASNKRPIDKLKDHIVLTTKKADVKRDDERIAYLLEDHSIRGWLNLTAENWSTWAIQSNYHPSVCLLMCKGRNFYEQSLGAEVPLKVDQLKTKSPYLKAYFQLQKGIQDSYGGVFNQRSERVNNYLQRVKDMDKPNQALCAIIARNDRYWRCIAPQPESSGWPFLGWLFGFGVRTKKDVQQDAEPLAKKSPYFRARCDYNGSLTKALRHRDKETGQYEWSDAQLMDMAKELSQESHAQDPLLQRIQRELMRRFDEPLLPPSVMPEKQTDPQSPSVMPAPQPVMPAKAGIQQPGTHASEPPPAADFKTVTPAAELSRTQPSSYDAFCRQYATHPNNPNLHEQWIQSMKQSYELNQARRFSHYCGFLGLNRATAILADLHRAKETYRQHYNETYQRYATWQIEQTRSADAKKSAVPPPPKDLPWQADFERQLTLFIASQSEVQLEGYRPLCTQAQMTVHYTRGQKNRHLITQQMVKWHQLQNPPSSARTQLLADHSAEAAAAPSADVKVDAGHQVVQPQPVIIRSAKTDQHPQPKPAAPAPELATPANGEQQSQLVMPAKAEPQPLFVMPAKAGIQQPGTHASASTTPADAKQPDPHSKALATTTTVPSGGMLTAAAGSSSNKTAAAVKTWSLNPDAKPAAHDPEVAINPNDTLHQHLTAAERKELEKAWRYGYACGWFGLNKPRQLTPEEMKKLKTKYREYAIKNHPSQKYMQTTPEQREQHAKVRDFAAAALKEDETRFDQRDPDKLKDDIFTETLESYNYLQAGMDFSSNVQGLIDDYLFHGFQIGQGFSDVKAENLADKMQWWAIFQGVMENKEWNQAFKQQIEEFKVEQQRYTAEFKAESERQLAEFKAERQQQRAELRAERERQAAAIANLEENYAKDKAEEKQQRKQNQAELDAKLENIAEVIKHSSARLDTLQTIIEQRSKSNSPVGEAAATTGDNKSTPSAASAAVAANSAPSATPGSLSAGDAQPKPAAPESVIPAQADAQPLSVMPEPVTPAPEPVIPAPHFVIPANAGIQQPSTHASDSATNPEVVALHSNTTAALSAANGPALFANGANKSAATIQTKTATADIITPSTPLSSK